MNGNSNSEDQEERKIREDYEAVCSKLNMDQPSMQSAWDSYKDISNYFALEGNHLEWLGCALYVAGQSLQLETVEGQSCNGNTVSLTQILRATKLNLIDFFKKMKKWMEMASLPVTFQSKIDALERKFEVASIIYDKYCKVFWELFEVGEERQPATSSTRQRGRKPNNKRPCSAPEVFRFGWTLYIHIKSQYPQINDDLVNSHHLLLCCLDMLYSAAYTKRRDLLHQQSAIFQEDLDQQGEELSVLPQLCHAYTGIEKECRVIRDFYWNKRLEGLFESKILSSSSGSTRSQVSNSNSALQSLLMLSPGVFQTNERNLNKEYEMSIMEKGDFDERVFLHPSANEEIGTPVPGGPPHSFHNTLDTQTSPCYVQYQTPLLGREHLEAKDQKLTPASEATQSVTQLYLLLEGWPPEPSEYVKKLCSSCVANPLPEVERIVGELGSKLVKMSMSDESNVTPVKEPSTFAKRRLNLSMSLYYKLLDAIMRDEEKKNPDFGALQTILEYSLFHKSLFSLSVEIVLFSYNSQSRTFPWVLGFFDISAYHFYKLIEVAIKLEVEFSRGMIKHLNRVEEMVLSELAWTSDSPLFDAIDAAGSVPLYKDVSLPVLTGVGRPMASPLVHPRVQKLGARGVPESPLSALHDRHTSPGSSARRALFSPGGTPKTPIPIAPKPAPSQAKGGVTIQRLTDALKMQLEGGGGGATQSPSKEGSALGGGMDISKSPPARNADAQASSRNVAMSHLAKLGSLGGLGATDSTIPLASTVLSPSKGLPSPGGLRPLIPTSPPIPTVTVVPSPQTTPLGGDVALGVVSNTPPRPKRTGSLALFYRKMYQLACVRIKDLCERLSLGQDFVLKVWTCFEHCMVKSPDLLRDRHLDQIIMCNLYILSKAMRIELTFQEIMRQYRHQPQAKSILYKNVLLNNGPRHRPPPDTSSANTEVGQQTDALPPMSSPHKPTSTTPLDDLLYRPDIEVGARGDVIQFYNKVFLEYIKDFVLKFSPTDIESNPSLSPLPVISKATPSPRKLSKHHNIYVSPHKAQSTASLSPLAKPIGKPFIIQKSPNVELKELSKAIKGTKRSPPDLSASPYQSIAKRPHASPRGQSPANRKLFQAMNSVASDRAANSSTSQ